MHQDGFLYWHPKRGPSRTPEDEPDTLHGLVSTGPMEWEDATPPDSTDPLNAQYQEVSSRLASLEIQADRVEAQGNYLKDMMEEAVGLTEAWLEAPRHHRQSER